MMSNERIIRNTLIADSSKQIAVLWPNLPKFAEICHEKMVARKHGWARTEGRGLEIPSKFQIELHCQSLISEFMDLLDTEMLSSGGITVRVHIGELQLTYGRSGSRPSSRPLLKLTTTKLEDVENGKEIDTTTSGQTT